MNDKSPAAVTCSTRRRPRQSRARVTAEALQQAFVQVLAKRGYEGVTVREVIRTAGTALGSFYEYFSGKEGLARISLHHRTKLLLQAMQAAVSAHSGRPLESMSEAVVTALLGEILSPEQEWRSHFLLERRLFDRAAYQRSHRQFSDAWLDAIRQSSDCDIDAALREVAESCHSIMYACVSHAYLSSDCSPDGVALRSRALCLIDACLRGARRCPAADG